MHGRSITIICRHDSFTRRALQIAEVFYEQRYHIKVFIVDEYLLPESIKKEINELVDKCGFEVKKGWPKSLTGDICFLSLTGGFIRKFYSKYFEVIKSRNRPILISGFPGLCYQNVLDGMVARSLCDILLINNEHEYEVYSKFVQKFGLRDVGIIVGFFSNINNRVDNTGMECDFVFADQMAAPNTVKERLYLAEKLMRFCDSIRGKGRLIIKPRVMSGEKTLFDSRLYILDAIKMIRKDLPDNLLITNNNIFNYIQKGASSITVSSTVGVETLEFHDKTYFIKDFGPVEQVGGEYFVDSGSYLLMDDLIKGCRTTINSRWKMKHYQLFDKEILLAKINEIDSKNIRPGLFNMGVVVQEDLCNFNFVETFWLQVALYKVLNKIKWVLHNLRRCLILHI